MNACLILMFVGFAIVLIGMTVDVIGSFVTCLPWYKSDWRTGPWMRVSRRIALLGLCLAFSGYSLIGFAGTDLGLAHNLFAILGAIAIFIMAMFVKEEWPRRMSA